MGCIASSDRRRSVLKTLRSAVEGAVLAASAGLAAALTAREELLRPIVQGLAAAWAASTASVAALAYARPRSAKAFWRAFGAGLALRATAFAGLMWWVWDDHWERQGALLGAYALGVLFLLLLEYKNL